MLRVRLVPDEQDLTTIRGCDPSPRAPELPRQDLPLRPRQLRGMEGAGARRPGSCGRAGCVALRERAGRLYAVPVGVGAQWELRCPLARRDQRFARAFGLG